MVKYITKFTFEWHLYRKLPDGTLENEPIKLDFGETPIGRGFKNKINCITSVASRNHCVVYVDIQGSVGIKDLNSTNGTFVGPEQLTPGEYSELTDGDLIGIGGNHEYEIDDSYVYKLIKVSNVPPKVDSKDS